MSVDEVLARFSVPLRVLAIAVSDAVFDALGERLARDGLTVALERAGDERALEEALTDRAWDLVLCEGQRAGVDALPALARHQVRAPLVLVCGEIDAPTLAQALRAGVADYVSKDHLEQLGPVVRRCLQEAALRARQRWVERSARDAEARMQSLMDHAPFPMSLRDLDGRFQIINRLGAELMGHRAKHLLGHTAAEMFDATAAAALDNQEAIVRQTGEATTFELTAPLLSGEERDYIVTKYPVRDSDGKLVGIGGISLDITARKRIENSLREAEDRFRGAFASAVIGMALVAPDGRWLQVNPALCDLVGFSETELLQGDFQAITHPDDLGSDLEHVRRTLAGEIQTYQLEKRYIHKLGHTIWVRSSVSLVRDAHGAPAHFVSQIQDISQQKRAEELAEQLRHAQKLDAIGRLAGGVAHDFNNMLTAIKGYSHLLLEGLQDGDPHRALAEQIGRAAEQASLLPRQLLAFSRKQISEPSLVDVNEVLTAAGDMLSRLVDETVELVLAPAAESASVLADPGHIEQVLLNLAVNAGEAMPEGGRLTLTTRNADIAPENSDELLAAPGRYVVISVADEGEGMDAETQEKLFEPFFTTKSTGSGLGLATVYGIVRQSAGCVRVESAPARGSTFEVWLPCAVPLSTADRTLAQERAAGTVLLAEDEQIVRDLAVTVLEGCGYRVLSAASGEEALDLCVAAGSDIELVLADMVMPGMSGRELARHVLELRPNAQVLLMSGYTEEAPLGSLGEGTQPAFLQKPFAPSALLDTVESLLGGSTTPVNHGSSSDRKGVFTCLVADDHPAVLDAVSRYLTENLIDVVAGVSCGEEALAQIETQRPAVALLDVRMLSRSGLEVAREASLTAPDTRIVLFTGFGDRALLEQALDAGVRGFVLKDAPLSELLEALHTVAGGGTYVAAQLTDTLASGRAVGALSPLTAREQQVLALIADGMTNDKAATELGISPETVQSHVRNAMGKLQADTRTQAVATAFRRSLLA